MRGPAALVLATTFGIASLRGQSPNHTVTSIAGIRVGHHTLTERPTGCTVVLADGGMVAGVAQRGAAPGTRETAVLRAENTIDRIDAVVLSGGSAYGLDTANGVIRWLDERGIRTARVPIVPAAVLIDLWVGNRPDIRPGADCGYHAAAAANADPVVEGSIGAGAGATVGKIAGVGRAMKAGIGTAAVELPNGLQVAAIVAVNALGDIVDPQTGQLVAGVRNTSGSLADARKLLRSGDLVQPGRAGDNTTIGVIATNARLTRADANRVALMADDGYARAIVPIHTQADGDTVFCLAAGRWQGTVDVTAIGALAADVMAQAIVSAAWHATSAAGIPAAGDSKK